MDSIKVKVVSITTIVVILGTILVIEFNSPTGVFGSDIDTDGVLDHIDNCPEFANTEQANFDNDQFGDDCDSDDDNDGISDEQDLFDQDPTEWSDFDADLIGDNKDLDDDNDNIVDVLDFFDHDYSYWADFDFDGIATEIDSDDDNDGISDLEDDTPLPISEQLAIKNLDNIQDCAIIESGTSRLLCYSVFFEKLVKQEENNSDALELALSLTKIGALDDCHFASHTIGHAAFDENPTIFENFKINDSICRGGYYHGIMAAYFHNLKENNEPLSDSYKTICDDFIGSSIYTDCIHGLGHGLAHYYVDDLQSVVSQCHKMSYFQNALCVSGAMMEYTDEQLTINKITKETVSDMCLKYNLDNLDYIICNMNIGVSAAFHNNHDLQESTKICNMINDEKGKQYCIDGLEKEILKQQTDNHTPLTEEEKEKFQPMSTRENQTVDFRSSAIIDDFDYNHKTQTLTFSFDKSTDVILHIPDGILPNKFIVMLNGEFMTSWSFAYDTYDNNTMVHIKPDKSGVISIMSA